MRRNNEVPNELESEMTEITGNLFSNECARWLKSFRKMFFSAPDIKINGFFRPLLSTFGAGTFWCSVTFFEGIGNLSIDSQHPLPGSSDFIVLGGFGFIVIALFFSILLGILLV